MDRTRRLRHTPGFLQDDELQRQSVLRGGAFGDVLSALHSTENTSSQLIVGARGTGKTTLLHNIASAIRRHPKLSAQWLPIFLAEDNARITTLGELWLEVLRQLAHHIPKWQERYHLLLAEPDEQRLWRRALASVLTCADELGRGILVMVEDLDRLLEERVRRPEELALLQETLLAEPRIRWLATTTHLPIPLGPKGPLVGTFDAITLSPLTLSGCDRLWLEITGAPLGRPQARAVQLLTGGNLWLVSRLAVLSPGPGLSQLQHSMEALVDDVTERYRRDISDLGRQDQRIATAAAELWKPSSTREIAALARMPLNQTSAILSRLEQKKTISITHKHGRTRYHQLTDRMLNLVYLMRDPTSAHKVSGLINALIRTYDLPATAPLLAGEAPTVYSVGEPSVAGFSLTSDYNELPFEIAELARDLSRRGGSL